MEDKDYIALTVTVTENTQRSRSNSHQIEELKERLDKMETKQEAIYELASSVKMIASDMSKMNESINEVKQGQKELTNKMDQQITDVREKIDKVDAKSKIDIVETSRDNIKQKITPFLLGGCSVAGVIYIIAEVIKALAK